jgi:Carboxypeptidase regulatory-like domain
VISMLLAGLIMPAFALNDNGTASFASVRGTVTTADHQTVSNARVLAFSNVGIGVTTTDSQGRYYFLNLLPGTYTIRAYPQTEVANVQPCSEENPVELSAGQSYLADYQIAPVCL